MRLTENENKVLNVLIATEKRYDEIGETGFSDVMLSDITTGCELNAKTVRGILGSLIKKDMVQTAEVNGEYYIYYLTSKARDHFKMQRVL